MTFSFQDVLIVKQFLTPEGYQLPRSITGLCYEQHREMKKLIDHASRAGKDGNRGGLGTPHHYNIIKFFFF